MADDPVMYTLSGRYVNLFEPDINTIVIEDIAWPLARTPRFVGHQKIRGNDNAFYSTGNHSLLVARIALALCSPNFNCRTILGSVVHDGSEAYLSDIFGPLKPFLPDYQAVEKNLQETIFQSVGLDLHQKQRDQIKLADRIATLAECDVIRKFRATGLENSIVWDERGWLNEIFCQAKKWVEYDPTPPGTTARRFIRAVTLLREEDRIWTREKLEFALSA